MRFTQRVHKILDNYANDVRNQASIARLLSTGRLGGTGKMVILPVDPGFRARPGALFRSEPGRLRSALSCAARGGRRPQCLCLGARHDRGGCRSVLPGIPLILKLNSSNTLYRSKEAPTQAITGSVDDAVRLGCAAIGYTIYPGSDAAFDMMNDLRELIREAKSKGLASVVWSYPRGGALSKDGELAMDISAYAAHPGADGRPRDQGEAADRLHRAGSTSRSTRRKKSTSPPRRRVRHVMQAAFNGKRLVVFSGGAMKGADAVYQDAQDIYDGGGNGQIIGRNTFQRPRDQALQMLDRIINIFLGRVRHGAAGRGRRASRPTPFSI